MKTIINTEILASKELDDFKKSPYPNSDFSIGRRVNYLTLRRNFIENLLLYDKVYILTKSFDEVITIKNWTGGHNLQELLHDNVIEFIQTPYAWTYIQKEKADKGTRSFHGIANIFISDEKRSPLLPHRGKGSLNENTLGGWSNPDLVEAIKYTLVKFYGFNNKVSKFARLVSRHTTRLNDEEFRRFITNKSHQDIQNEKLRKKLGFTENIDIENVPDKSSDIRRIFRIILANQNIAIMQCFKNADILTEEFYSSVLSEKLEGELRNKNVNRQSDELFELDRLPVPKVFESQKFIQISEVIGIRKSKEGENFRKWLHEHIDAQSDIKAAYVDLLKKEKDYPWHYKIIGVVAPAIISSMASVATQIPIVPDIVVNAAQEFGIKPLLDRYIRPNAPRVFMEKLKNELNSNSHKQK